ncbi:MAG: tetratricopeptide repeat protein [Kiritimatiellaeota bacterium]|nr:tetratricopeptide repeat protein [Kiritimatiellota bacterium]
MNQATNPESLLRLRPGLARLFLVMLVFVLWGRTLGYGFVWDDTYFITNLSSIRSVRNIPRMFTTLEAQADRGASFRVFRPIRNVVYCLLVLVGGGQPRPWLFHLANVLMHALNVLLLFELLRQGLRRAPPGRPGRTPDAGRECLWAALGAAAFGAHPANAEVVSWAKCLDDLLAAFFVLAALLFWLHRSKRSGAYVGAFLCYTLALYSKVSALPFLALPVLEALRAPRNSRRDAWMQALPFGAVAAVFLFHRHGIIGGTGQTAPISGSWLQTLIDMLPVATSYTRLLLGIPPFCCDYTFLKGGLRVGSPPVLLGASFLLVWIGATVAALRKKETRLMGFGLAWTGLFLAPVSNIVPMMQYMAERFLYLPLLGWAAVLTAAGALAAVRFRRGCAVLFLILIALWAGLAWRRSTLWRDELTLFVSDALEHPRGTRLAKNAVAAALQLPHMRRALTTASPSEVSWDGVWGTLDELRKLFPETGELYLALGVAYLKNGRREEGVAALERAKELIPDNADVWVNLAQFYLESKELDKARSALVRGLRAGPGSAAVRSKLAAWYRARGQAGNATRQETWLRRFAGHGPGGERAIGGAGR